MKIGRHLVGIGAVLALALTACGDAEVESGAPRSLTLYTCLSDESIPPGDQGFEEGDAGPGRPVPRADR